MKKRIIFAIMAVSVFMTALSGCKSLSSKKNQEDTEKLFELINKRLSYMKDVAAFKWVNEVNIEDIEREKVVIANAARAAGEEGLDEASTEQFFRVQIEAAKLIQRGWHKEWQENGFPEDVEFADLKTEIRPALTELGDDIIEQIKVVMPVLGNSGNQDRLQSMIKSQITVHYVDDTTKEQLLEALSRIKAGKK